MMFKASLLAFLSLALLIPLAAHAELTITTDLPDVTLNLGDVKEMTLKLKSTVNATYVITAVPMSVLNSSDSGPLVENVDTPAKFVVRAEKQGEYLIIINVTATAVSDNSIFFDNKTFTLHVTSPEQVNQAYALPNSQQTNTIVLRPGVTPTPGPDPGPGPVDGTDRDVDDKQQVRVDPRRASGGGGGGGGASVFAAGGDLIKLYSVSWNCNEKMVWAVFGDDLDHSVRLNTGGGQFEMSKSAVQDLPGRTIYEVDTFDQIITLRADATTFSNLVYSITESIRAEPCIGEKIFLEYTPDMVRPIVEPTVEPVPEPQVETEDPVEPVTEQPVETEDQVDEEERTEIDPLPPTPTPETVIPEVIECAEGTVLMDGICVAEDDGGCLIATAAYGSELAPQVQHLREIRDGSLMQTSAGAGFMSAFSTAYYSFSPTISDWQRQNPAFNDAVRVVLTPMLATLGIMDLADGEASVVSLGLGVIALNLGMYVAAPALVGMGAYRRLRR